MGLCSLTHQIDALNILNELQAHATAINRDGEGPCSGAVPGDVMKEPRKLKTIAERARESCITRLLEILTRLISIEEDLIKDASYGRRLLKRKDSVDLKNICLRMAVAEGGSHSDRDLRELRDCLRLIDFPSKTSLVRCIFCNIYFHRTLTPGSWRSGLNHCGLLTGQ